MEQEELRFIIDGKVYRASRQQVEERMIGVRPERITKHFVVINGQKYPIKQVLTIGLGVPRLAFTSQRAYRYLRQFGFTLGEVDGDELMEESHNDRGEQPRAASREPRATVDGAGAHVVNTFTPDDQRWQIWFRATEGGRYVFDHVAVYQKVSP